MAGRKEPRFGGAEDFYTRGNALQGTYGEGPALQNSPKSAGFRICQRPHVREAGLKVAPPPDVRFGRRSARCGKSRPRKSCQAAGLRKDIVIPAIWYSWRPRDAYIHYSPVMIAGLSKDWAGALLMKVGLFFCRARAPLRALGADAGASTATKAVSDVVGFIQLGDFAGGIDNDLERAVGGEAARRYGRHDIDSGAGRKSLACSR